MAGKLIRSVFLKMKRRAKKSGVRGLYILGLGSIQRNFGRCTCIYKCSVTDLSGIATFRINFETDRAKICELNAITSMKFGRNVKKLSKSVYFRNSQLFAHFANFG